MKWKLIQILSIFILGLIIKSCTVKKNIWKLEDHTINILDVDSLRFIHYYTCEFESTKNLKGYILVKKLTTKLKSIDKLILEKIYFDELCNVIEFRPNHSEITLRGQIDMTDIYEDGELIIDLSKDREKKYYQLCYKNPNERELRGKITSDGEPLIGVSLRQQGTINSTMTDIYGNFKLPIKMNEDIYLTINPCCTCYNSTEIKIEQSVCEIRIDCNCEKSKMIVKKKYLKGKAIKEKVSKIKIK